MLLPINKAIRIHVIKLELIFQLVGNYVCISSIYLPKQVYNFVI